MEHVHSPKVRSHKAQDASPCLEAFCVARAFRAAPTRSAARRSSAPRGPDAIHSICARSFFKGSCCVRVGAGGLCLACTGNEVVMFAALVATMVLEMTVGLGQIMKPISNCDACLGAR